MVEGIDTIPVVQLEAADQTTLSSLLAYDDGLPLDQLSLPDHPVSLPLDSVSRRQMAHAYRLIGHKYGKGRRMPIPSHPGRREHCKPASGLT